MSNNLSFPLFPSVVIFAPDSFLLSGDFYTWGNLAVYNPAEGLWYMDFLLFD